MKITKWILTTLLILIVVSVGVFFILFHFSAKGDTNLITKQTNEVKNMLHQKGVKDSEISSLKTDYNWKTDQYITSVTYKDEPKASYKYSAYGDSGEIVQDCDYYDQNGSQITSRKKELFHGKLLDGRPERKHRETYCPSDRQVKYWMIQRGYKESDQFYYGSEYPSKNSKFAVIFNAEFVNEPGITYYFLQEKESKKIVQACGYSDKNEKWIPNDTKGKHREKTCINYTPSQ
ncbi:DUF3139 domain-containing protein [Shimazuella sp. AN120528]|nr:DUF3139 domain-containing protein [Shimazuella soli]